MLTYRLIISQDRQLLGHFQSDTPTAQRAIGKIASSLSAAGYDLELQVAHDERRLLQSGPEGLRVISREALFVAVSLADHLHSSS